MERTQVFVCVESDAVAVAVLETIRRPPDVPEDKKQHVRHPRTLGEWVAEHDGVARAKGYVTQRQCELHTIVRSLAVVRVPSLEVLPATIQSLGYQQSQVVVLASQAVIRKPSGQRTIVHDVSRLKNEYLDGFPCVVFCKGGADPKRVANQLVANFVVKFVCNPMLRLMPWGLARKQRPKKAVDPNAWRVGRAKSNRLQRSEAS